MFCPYDKQREMVSTPRWHAATSPAGFGVPMPFPAMYAKFPGLNPGLGYAVLSGLSKT